MLGYDIYLAFSRETWNLGMGWLSNMSSAMLNPIQSISPFPSLPRVLDEYKKWQKSLLALGESCWIRSSICHLTRYFDYRCSPENPPGNLQEYVYEKGIFIFPCFFVNKIHREIHREVSFHFIVSNLDRYGRRIEMSFLILAIVRV